MRACVAGKSTLSFVRFDTDVAVYRMFIVSTTVSDFMQGAKLSAYLYLACEHKFFCFLACYLLTNFIFCRKVSMDVVPNEV
jgi:hypothetical protein